MNNSIFKKFGIIFSIIGLIGILALIVYFTYMNHESLIDLQQVTENFENSEKTTTSKDDYMVIDVENAEIGKDDIEELIKKEDNNIFSSNENDDFLIFDEDDSIENIDYNTNEKPTDILRKENNEDNSSTPSTSTNTNLDSNKNSNTQPSISNSQEISKEKESKTEIKDSSETSQKNYSKAKPKSNKTSTEKKEIDEKPNNTKSIAKKASNTYYNAKEQIVDNNNSFYTLQICSYLDFRKALTLRNQLYKEGYDAFIVIKRIKDNYYFRVNIGFFKTKNQANSFYNRFLKYDLKQYTSEKPLIFFYPYLYKKVN